MHVAACRSRIARLEGCSAPAVNGIAEAGVESWVSNPLGYAVSIL